MAQKTKAKTKPGKKTVKKPTNFNDCHSDADILLGVCEVCLRGLKSMKDSDRQQRWFFTKAAEAIRWAYACGYQNTESRAQNPFVSDTGHIGEITVRQLMEVVSEKTEFPRGLDTVIRIGDVEGNNGTNGNICLTFHRTGDVVLSIDPNEGDLNY